jgi:recombination protein RecA
VAVKKSDRSEISDILKKFAKAGLEAGTFEDITKPVVGMTTGNLAIDDATGIGGLPMGRLVESYGPPSSGKTTVALQTAAALQKKIIAEDSDDRILYIDFEHALDVSYCKSLGLDLNHSSVVVTQPPSLEKGAKLVRELVDTGKVRLVIWDSVAEAQPEAVLEAETGQSQIAIRAKIMSQFLQQTLNTFFENDCTVIFINHIQEKIASSGYSRAVIKTTPGGDALKFYASLRLEFTPMMKTKGKRFNKLTNSMEEFPVSTDTKVSVTKNKVGDPHRSCTVRVRYGKGFDNFWSALQVLLAHKKVTKAGAYFYFDRTTELLLPGLPEVGGRPGAFQGEDNLLKYADEHLEWRQHIIDYAVQVVASATSAGAVDESDDDDDPFSDLPKIDFS